MISKALKKTETSLVVSDEYDKLIHYFGNEFAVYEATNEQLDMAISPEIANSIKKVNKGDVRWTPGYDGVFGELVFDDSKKKTVDKKQKKLDEF